MKKTTLLHLIVLLFAMPFAGIAQGPAKSPDKKPVARTDIKTKPSVTQVVQAIDANMVYVSSGSFTMGCADEKDTSCYFWEKPAHKVSLNGFYLNKFPVTQLEWEVIMGTRPWWTKDCPDCPVENVSWFDAQMFINALNQASGKNYRLPTEAEWEYAARGGKQSKGYTYSGSNIPNNVAWYDSNSAQKTHPVGKKQPNELGLFDMSGNVWQWCSDWFDPKYYSNSPEQNPEGPRVDQYRVLRGGSWWSGTRDCRVANRDRYPPAARDDDVGFRLARD